MNKLRVAFMGSPDLGLPCLEALAAAADIDLLAAVTLGDRRRSRRGQPRPTPIGQGALDLGIPLLRWEKGRRVEIESELGKLALDVIVVIAFARILRKSLLDLPRLGCMNLHASLLPWGRGASPIQAAILEDLDETGWTAMQMDVGLDTGPLLATEFLSVNPREARWTSGELYAALKEAAPEFMLQTLRAWRSGEIVAEPQDESMATLTKRIPRDAGAVDWSLDAATLDRRIRAYSPAPGSWCRRGDERLGILAARPCNAASTGKPGELLATEHGMHVACGDGALELLELQPQGRKAMSVGAYLNGRPIEPGSILENG